MAIGKGNQHEEDSVNWMGCICESSIKATWFAKVGCDAITYTGSFPWTQAKG
ncbi:hypothetical protein HMI56_003561 [Coelomomyces lativittatus]|nr:hypothetical protein HMI56_003561 [Coelomomyces lativittatus]